MLVQRRVDRLAIGDVVVRNREQHQSYGEVVRIEHLLRQHRNKHGNLTGEVVTQQYIVDVNWFLSLQPPQRLTLWHDDTITIQI